MISARNIYKDYNGLEILKDISLEVSSGEILSVVGSSGAGKTTLLQILGTLEDMSPPKGEIELAGQSLRQLSAKALARFRNRHIGFVFQFHQLLPEFDAIENVCIPSYIARTPKAKAQKRAKELLALLGLEERMYHKPSQLSGGEQQRVSVARALVNNPSVIFADEPSGNLDSQSADKLHRMFLDLREAFGHTFVIVTHSEKLSKLGDRVVKMQDGQIVSDVSLKEKD